MLGWDKRRNLPVLLPSTYVLGKSDHLLGLPARRNSGKQSLGWPRDQAPVWSSPSEGGLTVPPSVVLRLTVAKKLQQWTSCEETPGGFREAETGPLHGKNHSERRWDRPRPTASRKRKTLIARKAPKAGHSYVSLEPDSPPSPRQKLALANTLITTFQRTWSSHVPMSVCENPNSVGFKNKEI